ncbi:MAG: hypothetical protein HUU38_32160 [Anaerolineales bacterium]|nr:hypothetical protein [Anaerolineales bacterium]
MFHRTPEPFIEEIIQGTAPSMLMQHPATSTTPDLVGMNLPRARNLARGLEAFGGFQRPLQI